MLKNNLSDNTEEVCVYRTVKLEKEEIKCNYTRNCSIAVQRNLNTVQCRHDFHVNGILIWHTGELWEVGGKNHNLIYKMIPTSASSSVSLILIGKKTKLLDKPEYWIKVIKEQECLHQITQ